MSNEAKKIGIGFDRSIVAMHTFTGLACLSYSQFSHVAERQIKFQFWEFVGKHLVAWPVVKVALKIILKHDNDN